MNGMFHVYVTIDSFELVPLQVNTNNLFLLPVSMVTRVNKMVSFMCGKSCCNTCYILLSMF